MAGFPGCRPRSPSRVAPVRKRGVSTCGGLMPGWQRPCSLPDASLHFPSDRCTIVPFARAAQPMMIARLNVQALPEGQWPTEVSL